MKERKWMVFYSITDSTGEERIFDGSNSEPGFIVEARTISGALRKALDKASTVRKALPVERVTILSIQAID